MAETRDQSGGRGKLPRDAGGSRFWSRQRPGESPSHWWNARKNELAVVEYEGDRVFAATFCELDGDRISAMYRVLNPEKLTHVQ